MHVLDKNTLQVIKMCYALIFNRTVYGLFSIMTCNKIKSDRSSLLVDMKNIVNQSMQFIKKKKVCGCKKT